MTGLETPDQEAIPLLHGESFFSRVAGVAQGAWIDVQESERKAVLPMTTIAAVGTLAVNFAKIPLIVAPSVALETLQYTDSPIVSGVVTGLIYGGWTWGASGIINAAGNHYPEAKEKVKIGFPKQANFISESLPGLHIAEMGESHDKSRLAKFGSTILEHARRGITIVGIGTTPYIVGAQLDKKPKEEVNRLRRLATLDGSLAIGSFSVLTAGVVAKVHNSNPELAEQIQDTATDTKTLVTAALSLIAGQAFNKWRIKRKEPPATKLA